MVPRRIFSIEEANRLIPEISRAFKNLYEIRTQMQTITKDIDTLFEIWGEDLLRRRNTDHQLYLQKERRREQTVERIRAMVDQINATGAMVRDVNHGIVDFYGELDGQVVFLCWRYGEDAVSHWHGLNEGFNGRKALSAPAQNV